MYKEQGEFQESIRWMQEYMSCKLNDAVVHSYLSYYSHNTCRVIEYWETFTNSLKIFLQLFKITESICIRIHLLHIFQFTSL